MTSATADAGPVASDVHGLRLAGRVTRGDFDVDVDIAARPGEVLAVLGPNGSGKSTLLRAIAGLAPLAEGRITLDGLTLDDAASGHFVAPQNRPVALVFQDQRLFPHLSVTDNVAFAARSSGTDRHAATASALDWLGRLGLTHLADRRPRALSGGEAQRVALARALAAEPRALLMDEPMSALDSRTRVEVRAELRRHLRSFEGPVVLVTHDPLEAMILADRIVVVEHGRVVQQGTASEVARRPRTDYVARLVGLNLYAGAFDASTGTVVLDGGGRLVTTSGPDAGEATAHGHRALVVLRPSAITVHPDHPGPGSPRNVWSGEIVDLEFVADRVRVQVAGPPDALVDLTAAALAELDLGPGSRVWLSAKATETEAYAE
ncbi:MAG: ABC transporter ATP-binding protein [Nostocoides sp.]